MKQYNSGLKVWWEFNAVRGLCPFEPTATIIIQFLTEQFLLGASHGTLNSFRSAISLIVGSWVGSDETIRRMFKGIFRLKPVTPKYDVTWDPEIVLSHISQWYPNSQLTLETITLKVVTLLALVTAHRVQTISLINIQNIVTGEEGLEIKIPDLIKTSRPGQLQPLLYLPFLKERPEICPAETLLDYIKRTKDLRNNHTRLILCFKKPNQAASSQTISRWIKQVLKNSGLDTKIFTAHSTRHAATSTANKRGVNVECIRKTAGWTEKSAVFVKYYNKQITTKGAFSKVVCNTT